jgi:hypothetical protein
MLIVSLARFYSQNWSMGIEFLNAGIGEGVFGFTLYAAKNYVDLKNVTKQVTKTSSDRV